MKTPEETLERLQQDLVALQDHTGWSQREVARQIGCHHPQISQISRGERLPARQLAKRIEDCLIAVRMVCTLTETVRYKPDWHKTILEDKGSTKEQKRIARDYGELIGRGGKTVWDAIAIAMGPERQIADTYGHTHWVGAGAGVFPSEDSRNA